MAYRAPGASGGTTQYLWAVLWRRLLSSALYLQQSQQTAVHSLHVAGKQMETGPKIKIYRDIVNILVKWTNINLNSYMHTFTCMQDHPWTDVLVRFCIQTSYDF